jgi:hypothetical protein
VLTQAGSTLPSLREIIASSLADMSTQRGRGRTPNFVAAVFVQYVSAAYSIAYGRPAKPGSKEGGGVSSPAVRFIEAVAQEARAARTVKLPYRSFVRSGLQITPSSINRLLIKGQA